VSYDGKVRLHSGKKSGVAWATPRHVSTRPPGRYVEI